MTRPQGSLDFGRRIMGPIVAEFCLRLWNLSALIDAPDAAALVFCARGGLRMQLAYERFLAASGLSSPLPSRPLMVSRLVAIRPALARALAEPDAAFGPAATAALVYEFGGISHRDAVAALSGREIDDALPEWDAPSTPDSLNRLLRTPSARAAKDDILEQADLFRRHLGEVLGDRTAPILVDTGLFGTTGQLLAEGFPHLDVATVLMARSFRPLLGAPDTAAVGLSVQARSYSVADRRTALLRYWHFIEWMFEPELPSVRVFRTEGARAVSNLEVDGWADRIAPAPDTVFAGVLDYLDGLPRPVATRVLADADVAWSRFRRAIIWPDRRTADALAVGRRSHDFGRSGTWGERAWRGPLAALRGKTMWREGEIARESTWGRLPLLAGIEAAYAGRQVVRSLRRRLARDGR